MNGNNCRNNTLITDYLEGITNDIALLILYLRRGMLPVGVEFDFPPNTLIHEDVLLEQHCDACRHIIDDRTALSWESLIGLFEKLEERLLDKYID